MTLPSAVLPLGSWKLTLPTGAKGKPTELKGADLAVASIPETFWADADAVHFRAPVNGVTTPNSNNTRCELREMKADGKTLASWSSTDGLGHTLLQDMAFLRLPTGNTGVGAVGGQVHDADDDIVVWRCEATGLWLAIGDHRTDWLLIDPTYQVGTRIQTALVVDNGEVIAYLNGVEVHRFDAAISGCYFRGGAYTQANAGAVPNDGTNFGETVYYSIRAIHGPVPVIAPSGPSAPPVVTPPVTDPLPVPPAPVKSVVIQVIRHGNKDDDGDGEDDNPHALSAIGRQRAQAIRDQGLFITPRADLYVPQYIFASGPPPTRMVETAQPTAAALGLPIDASLDSENAVTATAKLLAKQALAGQFVLAVLEHSCIAAVASALVKALGGKWNAKPPSDWDDADFSSIWLFRGDGNGNWTFSKADEGVLAGDPGFVAPAPPVTVPPVTVPPPVVVPDPPVVVDPGPPVIPTPPPVEPPITPEPPVVQPAPAPTQPDWWVRFVELLKRIFAAQ